MCVLPIDFDLYAAPESSIHNFESLVGVQWPFALSQHAIFSYQLLNYK